jgi:hypothetical protein
MTSEDKGVNFYIKVTKKNREEDLLKAINSILSRCIYDGDSRYAMRKLNRECLFWENLGFEIQFRETRDKALYSDKTLKDVYLQDFS